IRKAAEDASTAPVVVHIEDKNKTAESDNTDSHKSDIPVASIVETKAKSSDTGKSADADGSTNTDGTTGAEISADTDGSTGNMSESEDYAGAALGDDTVEFEANSFSVYAVVYTVDFHWEVDGKSYDFSIPGGGFVSLSDIIEILGIAKKDETEVSNEESEVNEKSEAESNSTEVDNDNKIVLTLEDVEVSEETHQFIADVENVEFSKPEKLWIGKIENKTTVGALKEEKTLNVQYSSELTDEQIEKINAQAVEADDWALISVLPFSSEEVLTVTMKNGEQFEIKVTDGQLHTYVISDSGDTYEVIVTYDDTAEIPDNAELCVSEIKNTEEKYAKNVEATNKELQSQNAPEVENPVQFEISILSNGAEIEPKEGSIVKVEIRLVPEVFGIQTETAKENESTVDGVKAAAEDKVIAETEDNFKAEAEDSTVAEKEDKGKAEAEKGEIWVNGEDILAAEEDEDTHYTVSHIIDDGTAEVIEDVSCFVNEEEKIVLQFETESFSDYLVDTDSSSNNTLSRLPNTLYVGDVIYLYDHSNYSVSGNGYSDVRINNNGKFREIRATSTGSFTITAPAWTEYVGWSQIQHPAESKTITVRAARTGTTPPVAIDTVDNASIGLTMHLFDYDLDNSLDSYFNNFNHNDHPVAASFLNENNSINNGHALKFWGSGIGSNYGTANQYDAHLVNSIVQDTLEGGVGGYPRLTANSNPGRSTESLAYLFSPSNGTDKEAYANVNHLFKKQGDYFIYDSNENYAYYDKSQGNGGSFEVYERTYEQKSREDGGEQASHTNGKAIGFFPFHKWDEGYDKYVNWNKTLNHHFGISMSVPFSMPKAPKAIEDTNGKPIIFEFSGDDDLWVYIDGKLAMDIGGIHQPTSGTINFTEQTVTVNDQSQNFDFSGLYDGEKHTLQVFYIERGGCDSNCKIMFNLTQYGDVEFDKVDADDNSVLLPGAVFGLYKDAECTQPLMEKLDAAHGGISRSFTVETDENGHAKLEDVPLGDYYLKEIHAPDGYPITIGSQAAHVRVYLDASGNVKVSVDGVESGIKITNKKPLPINLGVKKEWQDEDEQTISAPDGVTAAFEIKRIRTYEIYTEEKIEGEGRESSHLTVGWLHNGESYEYEEFDLVAGSHVTVSWSYKEGYDGTIGYRLNGIDSTKPPVPTNIYSQGFSMPAAGQNAVFYIFDNSETGEAISNINVAGSQFYGNSGGGYIQTFHQITEPDPGFTYTGSNVTDNKVTLPINESTWQYLFENLPTFENGTVTVANEEGEQEKDYDVVFHYSYYLEEASNTAPEGTTVIYRDFDGNEIQSPTDAETSTSGTETIINRVPFGYLKIEKAVTYNDSSENLTSDQKSKLAGEYKFKIYTKEQCGDGDAVQDPDAPEDAEDKDLTISITISENGQAVKSDAIKLLAGNYWIKEVESSNPSMFPVENPIPVTVTKNDISTNPVIESLTNNYDENNGPDKISVDIEKVFTGLDLSSQVPPDFQVKLHYTVNGQLKEVTLHSTELATGENGEKIVWSHSSDGFTWHWKVMNIPSEAKNFQIKELNYNKAKGYDWISASLNDENITSTVTAWHDLSVTAPAATLEDVTNDRRTSDSGGNTLFYLEDNDILLSKLTANQGTLVISKHPLNLAERDAIVNGWPAQGGFKTPPRFFSIEEHPTGFSYGNKTVTFGEKNGKTTVKFTQNASAQEDVFAVSYDSQEARNNANLVNTYKEVPITIDIIKVDKENNSKKLPGAVFTLRQLADVAPTNNGTLTPLS
ncbi:MAG: SpaA isopeptide-forming pilin-related protein, partial [Oscillospiraceae bacterium]|nr:SpaA isopeptide-forming pilin-related protein [Oscillospiraceae bacterium]